MSIIDMFKELIQKPSLIFTYFGIAGVVFTTTALLGLAANLFYPCAGNGGQSGRC